MTFDILRFDAVGDGVTNDAPAIQRAIDAAAEHGGGRVVVPAGHTFLSGSLVLKSQVELHIERGATLQASGNWADITERRTVGALSNGIIDDDSQTSGAFLTAYGATNIAVTGAGTIDGAGRHYVLEDLGPIYRMPVARPFTLFFIDCTDVTLTDSLYRDGALWTVRLTGCESVVIRDIRIRGDMKLPNADGIDLDRCRNVRISGCDIRCPDDAISLKSCDEFPDSGPCENITVANCILETRSSALVVGVDAVAPIRNVVFDNCVVVNSHRGLSVNLGQDSLYENILFSNIVVETRVYDSAWWGRGEPIYVSVYPWQDDIGRIRNVRFVNILARSESGVFVSAERPGLIDGILFENVRVELDKWGDVDGGEVDVRPYRDHAGVYASTIPGFHVENAAGVTIRDCEVAWGGNRQPYFGPALEVLGPDEVTISGFVGTDAHGSDAPHEPTKGE